MFDKLEELVGRLEEINMMLTEPEVINDQKKYRELMREQNELTPIVEKYKEYKAAKDGIEDSLAILDEESDEDMRELAKEELNECKETVEKCEQELKILMLPKDPNDEKNVIVEIRGGAGGDEAALFAADLFRMYSKFAEANRWKVEVMSASENGIGGFKEIVFMVIGAGAGSRHSIGVSVFGGMLAVAFLGSILVPAFFVMTNVVKEKAEEFINNRRKNQ